MACELSFTEVHTSRFVAATLGELPGTASVLSGMADRLAGTVKLIFQHAEEQPPGGARELVAAGVVDDADAIFGPHVMNQKTGTIEAAKGPATTSADGFYLTIQGRGSHGSMPQAGIDPVVVGAQLVLALNTIVSRSVDPSHMAVVNVGTFQAGDAPNVIPDTAALGVSIRTRSQTDRDLVHRSAEDVVKRICDTYGATCSPSTNGRSPTACAPRSKSSSTCSRPSRKLAFQGAWRYRSAANTAGAVASFPV